MRLRFGKEYKEENLDVENMMKVYIKVIMIIIIYWGGNVGTVMNSF